MEVTFKHPPVIDTAGNLSLDPFKDFDPSKKEHYPEEKLGIYINGIRLRINNIEKFVPVYVGIVYEDSLANRLFNHHYNKYKSCVGTYGKGNKDLWDFSSVSSLADLSNMYVEMYYYDYVNNYRKGVNRTSEKYLRELLNLKYLLYFQNKNYFVMQAGGVYTDLETKDREINHCDAINLGFDKYGKIKNTKNLYETSFYYVYCSYEDILKKLQDKNNNNMFLTYNTPKLLLERIELSTKNALNCIGLNTTSKAEGECLDLDINLTALQNELVNLGAHAYNVKGTYDNLIIKIRK
jgi:hypothetical protein